MHVVKVVFKNKGQASYSDIYSIGFIKGMMIGFGKNGLEAMSIPISEIEFLEIDPPEVE